MTSTTSLASFAPSVAIPTSVDRAAMPPSPSTIITAEWIAQTATEYNRLFSEQCDVKTTNEVKLVTAIAEEVEKTSIAGASLDEKGRQFLKTFQAVLQQINDPTPTAQQQAELMQWAEDLVEAYKNVHAHATESSTTVAAARVLATASRRNIGVGISGGIVSPPVATTSAAVTAPALTQDDYQAIADKVRTDSAALAKTLDKSKPNGGLQLFNLLPLIKDAFDAFLEHKKPTKEQAEALASGAIIGTLEIVLSVACPGIGTAITPLVALAVPYLVKGAVALGEWAIKEEEAHHCCRKFWCCEWRASSQAPQQSAPNRPLPAPTTVPMSSGITRQLSPLTAI